VALQKVLLVKSYCKSGKSTNYETKFEYKSCSISLITKIPLFLQKLNGMELAERQNLYIQGAKRRGKVHKLEIIDKAIELWQKRNSKYQILTDEKSYFYLQYNDISRPLLKFFK